MVFLGFFWGAKKIRVEIFSLKSRFRCGILGHTLELSPKHYQKEESLVIVLVLNPSSFLPSKIWRSTAFWKEQTIRTFCLISGGYCSSKIQRLELWHVTCSFILNIWNLGIIWHPSWVNICLSGRDRSFQPMIHILAVPPIRQGVSHWEGTSQLQPLFNKEDKKQKEKNDTTLPRLHWSWFYPQLQQTKHVGKGPFFFDGSSHVSKSDVLVVTTLPKRQHPRISRRTFVQGEDSGKNLGRICVMAQGALIIKSELQVNLQNELYIYFHALFFVVTNHEIFVVSFWCGVDLDSHVRIFHGFPDWELSMEQVHAIRRQKLVPDGLLCLGWPKKKEPCEGGAGPKGLLWKPRKS